MTPLDRTAIFTLTESDLGRAARLHLFSAIRERQAIIRLCLLWAIVIAGYAAISTALGMSWPKLRDALPIFSLIMVAIILGVYVGLPLLLNPFIIRRRFRQEKLLKQPVSVRWDEEVYVAEQPGMHNRIPWGDYVKRREDQHVFAFFVSEYNYQILPKRVLSEAQIVDIRRVLAAV